MFKLHIIGDMFIDAARLLVPIVLIAVWFLLDWLLRVSLRHMMRVTAARIRSSDVDEVKKQSL